MKNIKILICAFLGLSFSYPLFAQTIYLTHPYALHDIVKADSQHVFIPVDPQRKNQDYFGTNSESKTQPIKALPLYGGQFYTTFQIINQTSQTRWKVHINDIEVKKVSLLIKHNNNISVNESDFSIDHRSVAINPIGRAFSVELIPNERYSFAVVLDSDLYEFAPYITFTSEQHYTHWSKTLSYAQTVFIGIILGIIAYNFILIFFIRDISYLWFCLSVFSILTVYSLHTGIGWDLFDYQPMGGFFNTMAFAVGNIFHLFFAKSFLDLKRWSKQWRVTYQAHLVVCILLCLIGLFIPPETFTKVTYVISPLVVIFIIAAGIKSAKDGNTFATLFAIGWALFIIVWFLWLAGLFDYGEHGVLSDLVLLVAHTVIHSVAISMKINLLRQEKRLAESQNRAKSQFLATASHDLRQPLHAMGLFAASLSPHVQTPQGQRILNQLEQALNSMNKLFNALMDLTRLDAGAVKINRKTFNIGALLTELESEFTSLAEKKGLRFSVINCSCYVDSDPILLERSLRNLVSNAIRYTQQGRIILGCRRTQNDVSIKIIDTGLGIEENDQERIFQDYVQLKQNDTRGGEQSGLGLGLSIVHRICTLLEHPLTVQSSINKGSVFALKIPRAYQTNAVPAITSELPIETSLANLNVVIIDNDENVIKGMESLLSHWQCRTISATTAQEAMNLTLKRALTPDLLIADLELDNNETGVEAIALFKQKWHQLHAVIITGNTLAKCAQKDFAVLNKPVPPAQLRALLMHIKKQKEPLH